MGEQQKIKIGILGTAAIAERSVAPSILSLPNEFYLVGVGSRNIDSARVFANRFNIKAFGSYEEIVSKKIVDALYIPLPNSLHFEWVKRALENGLHVLVEKSLACNFSEAETLVNLARMKNLALVENFQFRFHTQLKFIKNQLLLGKIGELRCVRSSFGFPPFPDANNIRYQKDLGGGALLDAGAYPTKITQLFLGNDIEVRAATLQLDNKFGVDVWGGAFLCQKNGSLFSEIAFGFDNFYQCNLELWGSKGRIYTNRIFTSPSNHAPVVEMEFSGAEKQTVTLEKDNHFINMLNYFHRAIHNDKIKEIENTDNLIQAKLLNDIAVKANEK